MKWNLANCNNRMIASRHPDLKMLLRRNNPVARQRLLAPIIWMSIAGTASILLADNSVNDLMIP